MGESLIGRTMSSTEIKVLKLRQMVFRRRGSLLRRLIEALASLALRLFFRRIETLNASIADFDGPLIFVMNHPNGLIDPGLVMTALPRKVSFLAKSTLFDVPLIRGILRVVEALPVYRKIDESDLSQNAKTFEACHRLLSAGGAIALFPEGVSHNSPKLLPIKTGAARIALGAISGFTEEATIRLRIVPVGMYYTSKTTFRSEALLYFGPPLNVDPVELDADGDLPREEVRSLTDRIEAALREVTVNAETQSEIESAGEAANLFASVGETLDPDGTVATRFEFVKRLLLDETDGGEGPPGTAELTLQISEYKRKLRKLGLEPENLSLAGRPFPFVVNRFVRPLIVLALFFPLAAAGVLIHAPAYQLSKLLGWRYSKHGVDDIVSTVKVISGLILMPLTWLLTTAAIYYLWSLNAAMLFFPIVIFSAYVALRSLEEFSSMAGWFRAVWLFIAKRGLFIELLVERRRLVNRLRGVS